VALLTMMAKSNTRDCAEYHHYHLFAKELVQVTVQHGRKTALTADIKLNVVTTDVARSRPRLVKTTRD